MLSRTTVVIPFYDRVVLVRLLDVPNSSVGFPKLPKWEPLLSQKRETILDTDEAASAEAGIPSIITFIAAAYLIVPASHRSFKPVRTRNKVL